MAHTRHDRIGRFHVTRWWYDSRAMAATRTRIVVDDSVLASRIGGRIRTARLAAGLTQQQLAAGRYTKAYISALEKGHAKPSMAALDFIASRLGLPASRFLSEDTRWGRVEADLLLASGCWADAADAYQAQLDLAPERSARADALLGLVEALCRLDRGREAIRLAVEAVGLLGALGRDSDAMLAGYWLAYAHVPRRQCPGGSLAPAVTAGTVPLRGGRRVRRPADAAADGAWRGGLGPRGPRGGRGLSRGSPRIRHRPR